MSITKNSIFRKFSIISLAFLLYATTLLGSYNRSAYAAEDALWGKGTSGAMAITTYIVSSLMVAGGGAAVAVDEYKDDIQKLSTEAVETWDQTEKEMWFNAAKAAYTTSDGIVTLSNSMKTSLDSLTGFLADGIYDLLKLGEANNYLSGLNESFFSKTTSDITITDYDLSWSFTLGSTVYTSSQWVLDPTGGAYDDKVSLLYRDQNGYYLSVMQLSHSLYPTILTEYEAIQDYADFNAFIGKFFGQALNPAKADSDVPTVQTLNDYTNTAVNELKGFNEVNIPMDQFLATNVAGQPVSVDTTTGAVLNPDGTTYEGDIGWAFPLPAPTTIPGYASPAVPISTVGVGDIPIVGTPPGTTIPPSAGGSSNPFTNLVPISFLLVILDLLRAILFYLARMFTFILTIPLIPSIPIDNAAFQWFKSAEIVGIQIYNVVSGLASIGLSFMVYKAIRRLLP